MECLGELNEEENNNMRDFSSSIQFAYSDTLWKAYVRKVL